MALVVKNPPANAGDSRDAGLIPWLGRFPGGWRGNPHQYSRLENPMDREAWRAGVHRIAESDTTEATLPHTEQTKSNNRYILGYTYNLGIYWAVPKFLLMILLLLLAILFLHCLFQKVLPLTLPSA